MFQKSVPVVEPTAVLPVSAKGGNVMIKILAKPGAKLNSITGSQNQHVFLLFNSFLSWIGFIIEDIMKMYLHDDILFDIFLHDTILSVISWKLLVM